MDLKLPYASIRLKPSCGGQTLRICHDRGIRFPPKRAPRPFERGLELHKRGGDWRSGIGFNLNHRFSGSIQPDIVDGPVTLDDYNPD